MNKGRVYKTGTVAQIFSLSEELSEIGLDVPAISKIVMELKRRGINLTGELYTVNGALNAILDYIGGKER